MGDEDKVRVIFHRNIITNEIEITKGTRGWALLDEEVIVNKKVQTDMVHVILDDGRDCCVYWQYLVRPIYDKKEARVNYDKNQV